MTRPNFFVVGAPKAGTTAVYAFLREHPEVFMSARKEPFFFCRGDAGWPSAWGVQSAEEYAALFADVPPGARAVGEASTWYLYSPSAAARIRAYAPDARIVAVLRAPAERAHSNWSFNVQQGLDPLTTFEAALDAEPARRRTDAPWDFRYVEAGLYHEQVQRYLDAFGPEQVLVLFSDDLRADPGAAMRATFRFLGVEAGFRPETAVAHNETRYPKYPRLAQAMRRGSPVRVALRRALPAGLRQRLRRAAHTANRAPRPALDPSTRTRLDAAFAPDVERLARLVGRDLRGLWLHAA